MSRRTLPLVGLNSCERIRPERPRNPIQRLIWSGAQFQVGHVGSLEDEGSNPRMALRRLLRLYEGRQYREAAGFLARLPTYTLKTALPDIPIDLLIETLPHSLALLEALYTRLSELDIQDAKILRVEQLLWKVVHLISIAQDHFHVRTWTKLLGSLHRLAPGTKNALVARRRSLERAVEGLGKHGLVPSDQNVKPENATNAQNLVPLPVALKEELEARAEAYKLALHKIENFGKHGGSHKDQGVQAASHQRQLSMKYSEIQQRLIDNQSLLNTLEKTTGLALENLLGELKRRVEQDKEALRQWTALRKLNGSSNAKNPALAARLLQFSRGCGLALQLMNEDGHQELQPEENNFMDDYEEESSSAGYHTDESGSPTPEPGSRSGENSVERNFQNLPDAGGEVTVEHLTERYRALYAQAYLHTLDALDTLEQLNGAPDLKAKILYSVVVLSWRMAGTIQTSRRLEALKILNGGTTSQQIACSSPAMDECVRRQLATFGIETGSREVAEQVVTQLQRTLYDFPCLRECPEIKQYAVACSSLAWSCLARTTPLVLDVAQGAEFRREVHARHHGSADPNGTKIKAVLWPGLREGCQGPCLHRAVVLTC